VLGEPAPSPADQSALWLGSQSSAALVFEIGGERSISIRDQFGRLDISLIGFEKFDIPAEITVGSHYKCYQADDPPVVDTAVGR
jgi:hypothetical protein